MVRKMPSRSPKEKGPRGGGLDMIVESSQRKASSSSRILSTKSDVHSLRQYPCSSRGSNPSLTLWCFPDADSSQFCPKAPGVDANIVRYHGSVRGRHDDHVVNYSFQLLFQGFPTCADTFISLSLYSN